VYAAVAGVGVALSYYARWREREMTAARLEAQLSEARLQSLKAQLHPHFLFNSLHAVASLIRTGDDAGAIRTIAGLSDLLRRVLDADTRPLVPLSEEAGFIERYFEIQRVRFGDRLRTSLEIEAGTENVQVPAMLLQPLVENAFRHGLADRVEAGEIIVRAKRAGDRLELVVEDNGQGLPQGWNRADRAGIGLKTTAARLEHVYRSSAEFHVEPRDGGGTRVTIRVPA
jgi:sensor histidine kinase YesM